MRWTRWTGLVAGALGVAGCGYGFEMVGHTPYRERGAALHFSAASRPHPSYFCYDCHGYRYFDPYYDYCVDYGFRYHWDDHPQVVAIYRDRYVGIREGHPEYGRYRYREDYRATPRYREPQDFETWRGAMKSRPPAARPAEKRREKEAGRPGRNQGKGDERKGPRDRESRLSLPGGSR